MGSGFAGIRVCLDQELLGSDLLGSRFDGIKDCWDQGLIGSGFIVIRVCWD